MTPDRIDRGDYGRCIREHKFDLRTCRIDPNGKDAVICDASELLSKTALWPSRPISLARVGEDVAANYFIVSRSISRIKSDRVEKLS